MSNLMLSGGERWLGSLMRHAPVTAIRHHLLDMLSSALINNGQANSVRFVEDAAAPLCAALGVRTIDQVPEAICALKGRPPRAVQTALRGGEFAIGIAAAFEQLDLFELADRARLWSIHTSQDVMSSRMSAHQAEMRHDLVQKLRARALEILAAWHKDPEKVIWGMQQIVDGRALTAAARAWQIPLITGSVPALPSASAAMHPNRLGRTAAAVAFARTRDALSRQCPAPDAWVFESLALLVAVGEAITGDPDNPGGTSYVNVSSEGFQVPPIRVSMGERVSVRSNAIVGDEAFDIACWWPIFDSWGSQSKRTARAIPTAWNLFDAEADVLIWALCSIAARIATAAAAPKQQQTTTKVFNAEQDGRQWPQAKWDEWASKELSAWEIGAQSVWMLMLSRRQLGGRTQWPGSLMWSLNDPDSFPWRMVPAEDVA